MPRQKINERGEKTAFPEIILSKRKGGIALGIPPFRIGNSKQRQKKLMH